MKHSATINHHFIITTFILFLSGFSAPVYSVNDDSEIYLNSQFSAATANILLNLDTTVSMENIVDENNNGISGELGERSRLEVMKEATINLLDNMPAVNVGLLRYHRYGGPILFPVSNLNAFVCEIEDNCSDSSAPSGIAQLISPMSDGNQDVEESESSNTAARTVTLDSSILTMGHSASGSACTESAVRYHIDPSESNAIMDKGPADGSNPNLASSDRLLIPANNYGKKIISGLWFHGVDIPSTGIITEARIIFTVRGQNARTSESMVVNIQAIDPLNVDVDHAFDQTGFSPSELLAGHSIGNAVEWTIAADDNPMPGDPLVSDNIAPLINGIIGTTGWDNISRKKKNMVFTIVDDPTTADSGQRNFDAVGENPPILEIRSKTCDIPGAANIDTGLRFHRIKLPQGQNIENARIDFTAASDDVGNPEFIIKIENADTAAAYNANDGDNLSSRNYNQNTIVWTPGPWTRDEIYSTPDLADMIEEVSNRAGWCGGGDLQIMIEYTGGSQDKRQAYAHDGGNSSKAPRLYLAYDNDNRDSGAMTGIPNACTAHTSSSKIINGKDDAEEHADGTIDLTGSRLNLQGAGNRTIGLRFTDVHIPQGAPITSAKLTLTARTLGTGNAFLTIRGQDSDNASAFSAATHNISDTANRPRTAASATYTSPDFDGHSAYDYESIDLSNIVQEIVDRNSWTSGNDLALFVTGSGGGERVASSFEHGPAGSASLSVEYQGTPAVAKQTVREHLKDTIENFVTRSGTPILGTVVEAAHYFRGEEVRFGRQRGLQQTGDRFIPLSHPASYTANGANVTYPSACTAANPTHPDCASQVIQGGTPTYKSPITAECQSNYLVSLTDGKGFFTGSGLTDTLGQTLDAKDLTNNFEAEDSSGNPVSLTTCNSKTTLSDGSEFDGGAHDRCLVKLTKFLYENDQIYSNSQNLVTGSAPIEGLQNIETHTIGFNLCGEGNVTSKNIHNQQVCCPVANHDINTGVCSIPINDPIPISTLKAMADVGGGQYYNANTSSELLTALSEVTSSIISRGTSFSSPAIAANAFNRLLSRDEVYFGLFEPNRQTKWAGNLKKYNLCTVTDRNGDAVQDCTLGSVLDAKPGLDPAIVDDPTSPYDGLFSTDAQSEWSDNTDGREIQVGGAGGEITDFTTRLLYTEINDSGMASNGTVLSATGHFLTSSNWADGDHDAWRDRVCSTPSDIANSDCEKQMLFLLGKDIFDEDDNPGTDTRWWFNDILHSSPVGITYGQTVDGDFIDKIVVASNDGALHFINGNTGVEEWAFIPSKLLEMQSLLYENNSTRHKYGIDSTPMVKIVDVDNDGTIEPAAGDSVTVIISQRRGGSSIFALDITPSATMTNTSDTVEPKFRWIINPTGGDSGTGDFDRMGQSWSEPVFATIGSESGSTTNTPLDVLIFAGGYDIDLDDDDNGGLDPDRNFALEGGAPNMGNAIYIVDPSDGSLIFDISHAGHTGLGITASGSDIEVPNMFYAIPSNVTVFDSDGDGLDDRLYVGDTSGKVWRVDFKGDVKTSGGSKEGSTVVGQLADISDSTDVVSQRRIFYKPAVVQVKDHIYSDAAGGEFDYIVFGTGNRANPLALKTSDRLYAIRDAMIGPMADADNDHLADNYPQEVDLSGTLQGGVIDNADLTNATATSLNPATDKTSLGWYIDFDTLLVDGSIQDGEKIMAAVGVFNNTVIATTYIPATFSSVIDACSAAEGSGRAFNLNLLDAGAAIDWDGDGDIDTSDRVASLGSGIPSEAVPIFTTEGVTLLVGTGGGAENLGQVADIPRVRTYWYEE